MYPMWMNKGGTTTIVEVPVGGGGSGGGGGFTMAYRDRPLPKVVIRRLKEEGDESINITVTRVIDLSLNGGNT